MAIKKPITHTTGDILDHHIINGLHIRRDRDAIDIQFHHFEGADRYNTNKVPGCITRYSFELNNNVPTPVLQAMGDLKDAIEMAALALPKFSGGTIVRDNGDPI